VNKTNYNKEYQEEYRKRPEIRAKLELKKQKRIALRLQQLIKKAREEKNE